MYSKSIEQLIRAFGKLPSVGHRTAERFVFYLLKSGKKEVSELQVALKQLVENVKSCEMCWNFSDTNPCTLCADPKRDHDIVCVVAESQDLHAIEKTHTFTGVYHILRGLIQADADPAPMHLKINELIARAKKSTEIILALNPTLEGETTMMFLEKKLKEIAPQVTVTRLARGLPMGSDLQYADEITLGSALKNRIKN